LAAILSGWSASRELTRWLAAYDVAVPVSPELAELLRASTEWRQRTGGAFDPAAQAIVEWLREGTPRLAHRRSAQRRAGGANRQWRHGHQETLTMQKFDPMRRSGAATSSAGSRDSRSPLRG
jgi:thiamine biosynthesis lipoprotein ApbE